MTIRIDYSYMIGAPVGGVAEEDWRASADRFAAAHAGFAELVLSGAVGFPDLPRDLALLGQSLAFADGVRFRYDDVVILGIGGSALGPIALRTALRPHGWNALEDRARDGYPRLHVLDNVDPVTITSTLERIDLARTLFIVTSKSGGTAETMAQFLVVQQRLDEAGLKAPEHLVFVTDPSQGALRPLAQARGIPALDIPQNVGGRFSVLSPVGILPAALIGIDVTGIIRGAGEMAARCVTPDLTSNPAGVVATLQWLSDTRLGKPVSVFMPYADSLRDFALWFVQLWGESLGKKTSAGVAVGPTPIPAVGATDQHSQIQLFMEGPADKTVMFVTVDERDPDLAIPALFTDVKELGYLGGHTLGELIDVEQRATAGALAKKGRPSMTLTLRRVDEHNIGELIMLLELATAFAGQLYGINAFDQPGVELGKQFTYALLGRPGAEDARREWESVPGGDPRWEL